MQTEHIPSRLIGKSLGQIVEASSYAVWASTFDAFRDLLTTTSWIKQAIGDENYENRQTDVLSRTGNGFLRR